VRNGIVPAPRSVTRTVPEQLERVILKALANDPKERYQTASELHDDLMRFTLQGDQVYGSRQLAEWLREEFSADFEREQARLSVWLGVEKVEITPPEAARASVVVGSGDVGITPRDPFPGPSFLAEVAKAQNEITQQWRIRADQDTLALPPTPPAGSTPVVLKRTDDAQELPTMKMNDEDLILAERELAARTRKTPPLAPPPPPKLQPATRVVKSAPPPLVFDLSEERTAAPRAQRKGAMTKSLKEQEMAQPTKRRTGLWIGLSALALVVIGAGWFMWPEAEVRPGKVIVTPSPSVTADLIIDGKPSGQLPPFVHTVAAGTHKIEVRADGYKPWSTTVQVPSGGRPLEVDAQLSAEKPMEVEGVVLTQKTPAPDTAQDAKKKWWQKKTAAAAPPPPKEEPVVQDESPRLRIITDPTGADLTIDGKPAGRSPLTSEPLDPGPVHVVTAALEGYAPARRAAKLEPAGVTDLKLSLSQSGPQVAEASTAPAAGVGYLTADTKPASRLTIDGRDTGRWTPVPKANPIPLTPGAHTIVFESADGRKLEEQLEIEPGKTQRLIRSLP
jgi:hypothetical protein